MFLPAAHRDHLEADLVAGVFYRLAGSFGSRNRAPAQKQVVVATRQLGVGSTLDRASVALRSVPESLFPAGGFSRVEDVLERPVINSIQADEPVIEARIAVKGSGVGLGPLIAPGMRAISVRVNDVVGVAGFALPGNFVDIIVHTQADDAARQHERPISKIVLERILVLAVAQENDRSVTLRFAAGRAIRLDLSHNLSGCRRRQSQRTSNLRRQVLNGHAQLATCIGIR
jgi:pilus assembly protein CpaB